MWSRGGGFVVQGQLLLKSKPQGQPDLHKSLSQNKAGKHYTRKTNTRKKRKMKLEKNGAKTLKYQINGGKFLNVATSHIAHFPTYYVGI